MDIGRNISTKRTRKLECHHIPTVLGNWVQNNEEIIRTQILAREKGSIETNQTESNGFELNPNQRKTTESSEMG